MAKPKMNNNKVSLPGMEQFMVEEEEEYLLEGTKNTSYFDAVSLPDSPKYQANAEGATTYTLYVVFPDRDGLVRAITALTKRGRKGLAAGAKIGTLNGIAVMKDGLSLLEAWEQDMLGIAPKREEVDPDEAQAPI
jgi:hypothetical protein